MIKESTPVQMRRQMVKLSRKKDRILILGSCFADNISAKLREDGFTLLANPFGTLYNPASISASLDRIATGLPFESSDCIQMGAGSPLICSFSHHTSFARTSPEEFLQNANQALEMAHNFWNTCTAVIITLGTAYVWKHEGRVVSNCLKRPAAEFAHELMSTAECSVILQRIVDANPGKKFIFTVSPIRHLNQDARPMDSGAHANTLSKATLQLSLPALTDRVAYFPAYEILLDELRDYRFYAPDLCHPAPEAVDVIWDHFSKAFLRK